jgi:hypothetical protein
MLDLASAYVNALGWPQRLNARSAQNDPPPLGYFHFRKLGVTFPG